ncbi:hypothetical protein FQA39_LY00314 [Lamprigera yunnana]|nr:hypothetical protein FQA39_LY00314 [Lamprigera yunnana]
MCEYNNNSGRAEMAGGDIDLNAALMQKDLFIREQHDQIIRLKRELDGVVSERDLLLCEVSNLRFELEMVELKRLQEERPSGRSRSLVYLTKFRVRRPQEVLENNKNRAPEVN